MRESLLKVMFLSLSLVICLGTSVMAQTLGQIKNFRQLEGTEDTITLAWDFEAGDDPALTFYTLLNEEEGFETNVKCPLESCTTVVDFLNACSEYHFSLTPHFVGTIVGDKASTSGHTSDVLPGSPINLNVEGTGEGDTTISWDIPTENPQCIEEYQICMRLEGETDQECFNTTETTETLDMLQLCSHYFFTVKGLTHIGGLGEESAIELKTVDGVPGEPQDLQVKEWGPDSVTVTFHDPLINPLCVEIFAFTWHEHTYLTQSRSISSTHVSKGHRCDPICENTIAPLPPCRNVTIAVSASNSVGIEGTAASVETSTEDLDPLPPSSVDAEPIDPTTIQVSWNGNPGDTCAFDAEVCWVDEVVFDEQCQIVSVDRDGSGIYDINGVLPCTEYEITVVFKSPLGKESDLTRLVQSTTDIEPSPVVDLKIVDVGTTDVTFTYSMPDTNPQCAVDVKDKYIDVTNGHPSLESLTSGQKVKVTSPSSTIHKDGLLSCSDYYIEVRTMSPSGLESAPANISFTTEPAPSTSPQTFEVHDIHVTSAIFQWLKPKENSRCVTEYRLTISDTTTSNEYVISASRDSPTKMTYAVDDLSSCTEYKAYLSAKASGSASDPAFAAFKTLCS
ncbi:receptor-type tyrosine-protein phosphatase F-like [Palaemon carinicauda]|uniref:receptor-type tyrosine-protein phosphatase F-like n=1 Tax=Palaemon carinicauda TaxID=392227 RepID=UPI0035B6788C